MINGTINVAIATEHIVLAAHVLTRHLLDRAFDEEASTFARHPGSLKLLVLLTVVTRPATAAARKTSTRSPFDARKWGQVFYCLLRPLLKITAEANNKDLTRPVTLSQFIVYGLLRLSL